MEGFDQALKDFIAQRPIVAASVQLVLTNGERFMVSGMDASPIPGMLRVDAFPDDLDQMVERTDGEWTGIKVTPTRMLVPVPAVARVVFMVKPPGRGAMGFRSSDTIEDDGVGS